MPSLPDIEAKAAESYRRWRESRGYTVRIVLPDGRVVWSKPEWGDINVAA